MTCPSPEPMLSKIQKLIVCSAAGHYSSFDQYISFSRYSILCAALVCSPKLFSPMNLIVVIIFISFLLFVRVVNVCLAGHFYFGEFG